MVSNRIFQSDILTSVERVWFPGPCNQDGLTEQQGSGNEGEVKSWRTEKENSNENIKVKTIFAENQIITSLGPGTQTRRG